jgi:opacity protein-like surface antigen
MAKAPSKKAKRHHALLFLLSALIMAFSANLQAAWLTYFLGGLSAAYNTQNASYHLGPYDDSLHNKGFSPGVLGGWQARCRCFAYAIEFDFDKENDNDNRVTVPITPQQSAPRGGMVYANYSYGGNAALTLSASYIEPATSMALYVRAGVETREQTLNVTETIMKCTRSVRTELEHSNQSWRYLGGVGLEFPLWERTFLRTEYNYHSPGNSIEVSGLTFSDNTFAEAELTHGTHSVKTALVYHF